MSENAELDHWKSSTTALETMVRYQNNHLNKLVEEIERYRKEVERLQNLWYEACANQIFPPVQVQTIKMNTGA